jgi:hypothetical protein
LKRSDHRWIELLPGHSWLVLMVVPLAWQVALLPAGTASGAQLAIVTAGSAMLLLSDRWAARRPVVRLESGAPGAETVARRLAGVSAACAVLISATHLLLMPSIPLLAWLGAASGGESAESVLALARARATKQLPSLPWIDLVSTWSLSVLGPLGVAVYWHLKYRARAMLLTAWIAMYAVSTTAKFPLVAFVGCSALALAMLSTRACDTARRLVRSGVIVGAACIAACALWPTPMFAGPAENPSRLGEAAAATGLPSGLTLADRHRIWCAAEPSLRKPIPPAMAALEAYVYRAFFTPADVSIRWYQYFGEVASPIGLASVVARPEPDQRPSRVIARWAYVSRFPGLYSAHANASASVDADAFARGGPLAATAAMAGIALIRLGIRPLRDAGVVGQAAYGTSVALLAILPIHSSIQAILVVYNLLLMLFASACVAIASRRGSPPTGP